MFTYSIHDLYNHNLYPVTTLRFYVALHWYYDEYREKTGYIPGT